MDLTKQYRSKKFLTRLFKIRKNLKQKQQKQKKMQKITDKKNQLK